MPMTVMVAVVVAAVMAAATDTIPTGISMIAGENTIAQAMILGEIPSAVTTIATPINVTTVAQTLRGVLLSTKPTVTKNDCENLKGPDFSGPFFISASLISCPVCDGTNG